MKKIYPDERFYGVILSAYFDFIKLSMISAQKSKRYVFLIQDNIKGVRPEAYKGIIACDFDCLDKKISEKIYISVRYEERSKKLFVVFKLKSPDTFKGTLNAFKKKRQKKLLASYLNELAWSLQKTLLCVESPEYTDTGYYICPLVKKDTAYINPGLVVKNAPMNAYLADDVLIIIYNIFQKRKKEISLIKIDADDILFLKGIKKQGDNYKKADKKCIYDAIEYLCAYNLIHAKKLKRFSWALMVPENKYCDAYLIPKSLILLNPKTKYFEKYLGGYICYLMHLGRYETGLHRFVNYFLKRKKYLAPSKIRDKIEDAFDEMQNIGLIKCWEYKKIEEERLTGSNWLIEYKKLKIIFCIKKAEHFYSA